jgi:3-hydroxyacyl-[acyl-carrier-protein] dehydratase
MSMNNTKFRKLVKPGDTLNLSVTVNQSRRNVWKFHGEAYVCDEIVAESDFTAMMVDPNLESDQ